jgi:serine/threonine protein kinase
MHRDLKPANFFLNLFDGKIPHVLIGDFGLVRDVEDSNAEAETKGSFHIFKTK